MSLTLTSIEVLYPNVNLQRCPNRVDNGSLLSSGSSSSSTQAEPIQSIERLEESVESFLPSACYSAGSRPCDKGSELRAHIGVARLCVRLLDMCDHAG